MYVGVLGVSAPALQERGDPHDPVPYGEPGSRGDRDDVSGHLLPEPDGRRVQQREVTLRHQEVRQAGPGRTYPHQHLTRLRVWPAELLKLYHVHGIAEAYGFPGTAFEHEILLSGTTANSEPSFTAASFAHLGLFYFASWRSLRLLHEATVSQS